MEERQRRSATAGCNRLLARGLRSLLGDNKPASSARRRKTLVLRPTRANRVLGVAWDSCSRSELIPQVSVIDTLAMLGPDAAAALDPERA